MPLGEVLIKSREQINIDPHEQYKQVTIRLWGQGVVLRDEVAGTSIAGSKRFIVRPQQFILSRIDARNGAFGLVPEFLDGAVVSNDFPAFAPNPSRLLPAFLGWMSQTRSFVDLCKAASEGTTNRVRLKEHLFMATRIPLPSLPEQQRIVARIEELATRIEEARGLRRQAVEEARTFTTSSINDVMKTNQSDAEETTVGRVAYSLTDGDHQAPPKAESGIPFIFISHVASGKLDFTQCKWVTHEYFASLSSSRVPQRGDVLYTAVGSYGIPCLVDTDQPFCFQRHIAIIKPDRDRVIPEFLVKVLSSSDVYDQATAFATGSAQLTVPLRGIRKLRFLLPSLTEQRRIVAYLDDLRAKVDSLKQLQAETATELGVLLPSVLDRAFKGTL